MHVNLLEWYDKYLKIYHNHYIKINTIIPDHFYYYSQHVRSKFREKYSNK